ncbi:MAG: flagellar biosynthesis anti-sigma factor FlgM [Sandaracinaceae bacterium]|nr:MAG: flagellar biosynthesis anti-sigma factor FlgM [Sandaracinaceae bacterium]HBQ18974.1 flagellar biosynthesis anti-sigma factor FlgM [Myxococcales bacterium]
MKITGQNPYSKIESTRERKGAPASESAKAESAVGRPAAEVEMSDAARAMREARAPEQPDAQKVARLKQAILDGEFRIDPERIASAMFDEER